MSEALRRFIGSALPAASASMGELVVVPTAASLATEIRNEHSKVMTALADSLRAAIAAGKHLSHAKALLKKEKGHGLWQDYVGIECGLSIRTAQNYMHLAKHEAQLAPLLSDKAQGSAFLSQNAALKFLGDERKKRKKRKASKPDSA
ncbi:DUF3102 domain-containing protein [Bradyrhizobium septentrionale]|uniref:DUF3102 domain-containing protein n=1 Tax=Bradyrhizobium septentrionale TaxID=1404411 RepID=UPI001596677D|nr:DUF3102 domain-containing protein [Bradyrhizobium septentrionale]UGY27308.1 DUF3102 domain-containing protein [Bradyrhizobium septentrionale]